MYHFKKKNSKKIPIGAYENVWGPARVFPRAPLWLSTGLHLRDGLVPMGRDVSHPGLPWIWISMDISMCGYEI